MSAKTDRALFRLMFLRMSVPSVLILLAFLVLVSTLLSMMAAHNRQTRMAYQQSRQQEALARVEDELLAIEFQQRKLINDEKFLEFVYMYDDYDWYKRYSMQSALQERLFSIRNTHSYVKSAHLYIPSMQKMISDVRVSANMPDWMLAPAYDEQRRYQRVNGSLIGTVTRADDDGGTLAILALDFDESHIRSQLDYLISNQSDALFLRWNGETLGTDLPSGMIETDLEQQEVTLSGRRFDIIRTDGARQPMRLYCLVGSDSTDAFISNAILIMWVFVGGVVMLMLTSLLIWYLQVYRPLHALLIDAFGRTEAGDLTHRINTKPNSPFFPVYGSYNRMMDRMEAYVEKDLKLQILVSKANLKQLQSQINPHFMYNSYYVLYRLIKKGDMDSSVALAEHLGEFFQYITRNADDEKRLSQEVEHAQVYAMIQQFRFKASMVFEIRELPSEIAQVYVPRLILQPLFENAFKHAFETNTGGSRMELLMSYRVSSARHFDILVENSGEVSDETLERIRARLQNTDEGAETTALTNIHRRLQIYYGAKSGLSVDRSVLGGLSVCMHIETDGAWGANQ